MMECSIGAQSSIVATSHMDYLLSSWNVTSMTVKLNFKFYLIIKLI